MSDTSVIGKVHFYWLHCSSRLDRTPGIREHVARFTEAAESAKTLMLVDFIRLKQCSNDVSSQMGKAAAWPSCMQRGGWERSCGCLTGPRTRPCLLTRPAALLYRMESRGESDGLLAVPLPLLLWQEAEGSRNEPFLVSLSVLLCEEKLREEGSWQLPQAGL